MTMAWILILLLWSGGASAADARPSITGISHIAVYAADPVASEGFYVHDLGGIKGEDPESGGGARYYFSPRQYVEVLPLPREPVSVNRLDHVAFATPDVHALRRYLAKRAITTATEITRSGDGSERFSVLDPEGNRIEFVTDAMQLPEVPANGLSSHLIHVGFIVHDRAREDAFFRQVLGFRPYWFGGMQDDVPTWISLQVPNGSDWLEYMLVGSPEERGIPADMKPSDVGILNHFSLGVANIESAYTLLWNGGRLKDPSITPKIGRDAKWQLNLLDPDGTRAEIMELHAIGKPCCSPFTAADPER
jgi:catechol 2,3-dioxygenase-like lactoylglutathione lyase family enzyme